MRKSRIILAGFAAAAAVAAPVAATGIAQASTGSAHAVTHAAQPSFKDCGSGNACMYTDPGWVNGTAEHRWYKYGCYNLSNETGYRWLANAQTGGATFSWYYGSGCTHKAGQLNPGGYQRVDITPINSVSLNPS